MTDSRQYVAVKFRKDDTRTYTYHNDGPPVAAGDEVKVMDKSGDGWKRVYVAEVGVPKPMAFDTKAIIGKVDPEPARDLLADDDARRDIDEDVQSFIDRDRE